MRLIALLLLVLPFGNDANAQRSSSGTFNIDGRCFDKASYSFNYSFSKENIEDNGLKFTVKCNLNINFHYPNDAIFTSGGKSYRPSDFGLSQWPRNGQQGLQLELAFYHNNILLFRETYESATIQIGAQIVERTYSMTEQKTVKYEPWFISARQGPKIQNFNMENCRVEVEGIKSILCPSFAEELPKMLAGKDNATSSSSSSSGSSSSTASTNPASNSNSSPASSTYNEETAVLVGKTVEAGVAFFDGLAANARAKRERKINDKLDEAESKLKSRNLENCNTKDCNEDKGDIYKAAAYDGYRSFSFTMRDHYLPEVWKIADGYYTKAASQGSTYAMEKLIRVYGSSSVQSEELLKYWVKKLLDTYESKAKEGYIGSMYWAAQIYDNWGKGFHKDYEDNKKAIYWYERSAHNGYADAQERLIDVYKNGRMDQEKDFTKSLKYASDLFYNKSATYKQKKSAQKDIMDMYKDGGNGIGKNLQLAKDWEAKVPDFYEYFNTNENGWEENETKAAVYSIKNGKRFFQVNKQNTWVSSISLRCDQDRDFEISSTIRKVEGSDKVFFGLLLGSDKKFKNYFALIMSEQGRFGLKRNSDPPAILTQGIPASLKKENNFNQLTIRKIGNLFRIYINNEFVGEAPFEKFFGDQFGFIIMAENEKFIIEADDFVIKEYKASGAGEK